MEDGWRLSYLEVYFTDFRVWELTTPLISEDVSADLYWQCFYTFCGRENKGKCSSVIEGRIHMDFDMKYFGNLVNDRQADPVSFWDKGNTPVESPCLLFPGHADAGIG